MLAALLLGLIAVAGNTPRGLAQLPASSPTWTPFHLIAANSDNAQVVKAGRSLLNAAQLSGVGSAPAYLKFYDTASSPTCGSTAVKKSLMIPAAPTAANGGGSNTVSLGINFFNGIAICVVTGIADTDDTAVAAATFNINFDYQ